MIYILTGNGKGKTTSAIGMGIRMVGAGGKVLMIQFLKSESSENKVIKKIKNFNLRAFGRKGFFLPQKELKKYPHLRKKGIKPLSKRDFELAEKGFDLAKRTAEKKNYNLLILDEFFLALKFGLLNRKRILNFLKENGRNLDIVLTGRYCPSWVIEIADLVTEFREEKHYYRKGIKPKKGIEY